MNGWVLPAFGALIMWGLYGFLPKFVTAHLDPKSALVYEALGGLMVALVALILLDFRLDFHPKGSIFAALTGMLGLLGAFCFLLAMAKGPVTLVAALSALYPVVTIFLAVTILHEAVTFKQAVGIALAIAAIVLTVA